MATTGVERDLHVLTLEAVRAGIDALQSQRIHEHFPAYLHLRQQALTSGSSANIEPVWREVGDLLKMPGGPPTKPHYRPFLSRNVQDPSGYWFNRNLAGSYAPRSIRSTSRFMLNSNGDGFALPQNHAQQALNVLLKGQKVPAWALASYYLRNFGFAFEGDGGHDVLIAAFKRQLLFDQSTDFDVLFDGQEPTTFTGTWFAPFTRTAVRPTMADEMALVPAVRTLEADDLGIGYTARAQSSHGSSAPDAPVLREGDPRLATIVNLLRRFGGVILSGPPGTSKSWLAGQIADWMTGGDDSRRADIQFHASYQFEDFMEGYRPKDDGTGFVRGDGVLLRMVREAHKHPDDDYVVVIDELSRADVGRVFGEALTYIERSKRGQTFQLPSGQDCSIPMNLYLITTMNPLDRGVDEVDAAFERRFAKIDMPPSRDLLEEILNRNELDRAIARRLLGWFSRINSRPSQNPAAAVGHAYFIDAVDADSLQDVWDYQLKYHVDRAFRYDPDTRTEVINGWSAIFDVTPVEGDAPLSSGEAGATEP